MKKILVLYFLFFTNCAFSQEGSLTFGIQYKPIFASRFFGAGEETGANDYFSGTRTPKLGISFGMQIRRGITKMFSYETGINYIRRNYWVECKDEVNGKSAKFDFGLVGYEIPNQVLVYIRLGENFYMNTATGISLNWFASDVASGTSDNQFFQQTYLHSGWIKVALIANLGFEIRTKKSGTFYLGSSLTNPFGNFANTYITYNENLATDDKVITLPLKGGIFTVDFRYFFNAEAIRKKANDKKK
jgi:hypothetical protein